jgi:hypothetical protein
MTSLIALMPIRGAGAIARATTSDASSRCVACGIGIPPASCPFKEEAGERSPEGTAVKEVADDPGPDDGVVT